MMDFIPILWAEINFNFGFYMGHDNHLESKCVKIAVFKNYTVRKDLS